MKTQQNLIEFTSRKNIRYLLTFLFDNGATISKEDVDRVLNVEFKKILQDAYDKQEAKEARKKLGIKGRAG